MPREPGKGAENSWKSGIPPPRLLLIGGMKRTSAPKTDRFMVIKERYGPKKPNHLRSGVKLLICVGVLNSGCLLALINHPDFNFYIKNGFSRDIKVKLCASENEARLVAPGAEVRFDRISPSAVFITVSNRTLVYKLSYDIERPEGWYYHAEGSNWFWLSPDLKLYIIPTKASKGFHDHYSQESLRFALEHQPKGYPVVGIEH